LKGERFADSEALRHVGGHFVYNANKFLGLGHRCLTVGGLLNRVFYVSLFILRFHYYSVLCVLYRILDKGFFVSDNDGLHLLILAKVTNFYPADSLVHLDS